MRQYCIIFILSTIFSTILCAQNNIEKVRLETDRDIYVAGEKILYSFYLSASPEDSGNKLSIIGYIELISSNNKPVAQSRILLKDNHSSGELNIPDSLGTGIYFLRAYTRYLRNTGDDAFFKQAIFIYNPLRSNQEVTRVDTTDKIYGNLNLLNNQVSENIYTIESPAGKGIQTRQEVRIKLKIDTSVFINPDKCRITASVAIPSGNFSNIISFDKPSGTGEKESFFKESLGPYIEGVALSRANRKPVVNRLLYLSIPGRNNYFQYSITDDEGRFRFIAPARSGPAEIVIQDSEFSNEVLITTSSSFEGINKDYSDHKFTPDDQLLDYASRMGVNYQVNKIYKTKLPGDTLVTDTANKKEYNFYGKAELRVNLDDYISLPTMQEVFHELVPGVSLRRMGEGAGFVFTGTRGSPASSNPGAVFLDGVFLRDHSLLAEIEPDSIEIIDVFYSPYKLGNLRINGFISIKSRNGNLCGIDYPDNGLRLSTVILDQQMSDYKGTFGELPENSRLPYFRNTLYWNPDIKPDKEGSIEFVFFTSDFESEYSITVRGFTDKNKAINYSGTFSVERK